ncbi:MAG: aldo/keto reductase [Verrucomicrobia bacterium]|nr:aldo/keto reductase [Verrucomicrobiota bacterium]
MKYRVLGDTGFNVSRLSFGASSLGGVFHSVDEKDAIAAVHVALDLGINYIDVAPAYGATRSETVLGKALKGIPRDHYYLSTKVGKTTAPGGYGHDEFNYSNAAIRNSLEDSSKRLGVDYFDIVHLHDIEYNDRQHTEWALGEGVQTLKTLKAEGRIGALSFGMYPMDLWARIIDEGVLDAGLIHNHYCLNDTRMTELLPMAAAKGIGLINASPFASGLLTSRGPADWHPASEADRAIFASAAAHCAERGEDIARLALQFASQNEAIATTMFSSANPDAIRRNVLWHSQPLDLQLVQDVRAILNPVINKQWSY